MRALVLVLLLANAAFFALARGWLQPLAGLASQNEREPQRLAAQWNPEAVRSVTTPASSTPANDTLVPHEAEAGAAVTPDATASAAN